MLGTQWGIVMAGKMAPQLQVQRTERNDIVHHGDVLRTATETKSKYVILTRITRW